MATGSINSLAVLALMRFVLGSMQAANDPTIYSLLSDYFPTNKVSTANAITACSGYVGSGLSSLSIILIATKGWRYCFNLMGGIGAVIAALAFFFVKEPVRGAF